MAAEYQAPEYREHRGVQAEARQASALQHLDWLAELLGQAERGMVDLLDARAQLEARIGYVLTDPNPRPTRTATLLEHPEKRTALDARLADLGHVLSALIGSIENEAEELRGIAQRVEL